MIKSMTQAMDIDEQEDGEALLLFHKAVLPFFQLMSHREIASSLVLEHSVEQIYNFLYGSGGHRGVQVFRFSAKVISIMVTEDDNDEEHRKHGTVLRPCLAVMERLVELNQGALLHQDFIPIIETVSSCTDPHKLFPESRRSLDKIRLRLGLGSLIPSAMTSKQAAAQTATYKFHHDLPGNLSSDGPRHDNDHQDIKDIHILPTEEEINSSRLEYLPFNNATNSHLPGLPGLLDRHFRLLREDAIGGLRDAVRREAERLETGTFQAMSPKQRNGERTYVHQDLKLRRWEVDRRKGLQLVADFAQPIAVSKIGERQRKEWWESSRRLQPTSLVCLVSSTGHNIFCLVCDPTPTAPSHKKQQDDDRSKAAQTLAAEFDYHRKKTEMPSLHKYDDRAAVMLTLVNNTSKDIKWISRLFVKVNSTVRMSLVEFPGVLLPTFQPTLQALQGMSKRLDLPFADYLAPQGAEIGTRNVPPPLYLQREDFVLDLSPLTDGEPLTLSTQQPFDRETFNECTSLDEAQQTAVFHALNSSLALIQGPPGTGKSYTGVSIIKVLLHNREAAELGPVICVCYTNHALDQLLEHLVQDGIKQVVRIGSRSKSELLQEVNLHDLAQQIPQTKDEGYEKYMLNQQLSSCIGEIETLLRDLNAPDSDDSLRSYLERNWPRHFEQLFESDMLDDGFKLVTRRNKGIAGYWLRSADPENTRDLPLNTLHGIPLEGMSISERRRLHAHWMHKRTKQLGEQVNKALEAYQQTREELDRYYKEQQRRALYEANIIGVTTSGLARNLDVLRHLNSKVMICEEAGEVLEAHTLTALLPSVQHAILIGDHEQLRPQVKNYDLCHENPRGKHLALDISLFERVVRQGSDMNNPAMPYSRLKIQRRMHPSIADLIRRTIYLDLEDHITVKQYRGIDGMADRLFWLNHNSREDGADLTQAHSDSKSNDFEVGIVSALASHLMRQGTYAAGDIAVLTPYVRQLQKLRRSLGEMFEIVMNERDSQALEEQENAEDQAITTIAPLVKKTQLLSALRVATVDNFQGEEAKVVILSFVRSNAEGKCGFLRTSNRINVALSRARHGMYIVGDAQTACSVPMWAEIISILQSRDCIGESLALCCPRHPNDPIKVKTPDDFAILSPEGGCNKRCSSRLHCGHACPNKCHSEALHLVVRCLERCSRTKEGCNHACPKPCGDPCDTKCEVTVANVQLPCGHDASVPCHQAQHPELVRCQVKEMHTMSGCGHEILIRCGDDPVADDIQCTGTCGTPLACGHDCKKPCTTCHTRIDGRVVETEHGKCTSRCGRPYTTCSHDCKSSCHGDEPCPLCNEPCQVQCHHSRCAKRCHEPCVPCVENCTWTCPHGQCQMPCAVPCDRLPCAERCSKSLSCWHQCPSVCGEACPQSKYCQVCGDKHIKSSMVDYYEALTYSEIDLDTDPCIFPSCGHVITRENLDQHMDMKDFYEYGIDESGAEIITAAKDTSQPLSIMVQKSCPACRAPIRNIHRYGRIARRAWIDEATKKFIIWANAGFVPMASRMSEVEKQFQSQAEDTREQDNLTGSLKTHFMTGAPLSLEESSDSQVRTIANLTKKNKRFQGGLRLRTAIKVFLSQVNEKEQPFSRIYDLVQDAKRHKGIEGTMKWTPEVLQTRNRLLATVLLLRCEYAIISNFLSACKGTAAAISIDFRDVQKACERLIKESQFRNQPANEAEGHLFWARFTALQRSMSASVPDGSQLLLTAREHLQTARQLCTRYQGQTAGMLSEVQDIEKALRDSTFYTSVTNEEKAAVYAAMASDFRGTGHWDYCENGHPFTVGECGMPMQTSRCPQCGAAVGGQQHQAFEGVRRAADMDEQFGRLHV